MLDRPYIQIKDPNKSANKNWITSFSYKKKEGKLYIGYWGDMPNVFNISTREWEDLDLKDNSLLTVEKHNKFFGSHFYINDLFIDGDGNVWYASWGGKLLKYDADQKELIHFGTNNPKDFEKLDHRTNNSTCVLVTKNGLLLLGNGDGHGLQIFNLKSGKKPGSFNAFTGKPIPNAGGYMTLVHDKNDTLSISNNYVQCIYEDSNGRIWVGTKDGLNKANITYGKDGITLKEIRFERYGNDRAHNLLHPYIVSILEDDERNLWLGSLNGLYKFSLDSLKVISHHTYNNGLQSNQFVANSCAKNLRGDLAFGGIKGINKFNPSNLPSIAGGKRNQNTHAILLSVDGVKTDFRDLIYDPKTKYLFKLNPDILLSPYQTFQHQLIGKDMEPKQGGLYNYAYENLEPGTYTFVITGHANDYIEEIERVDITIVPKPSYAFLLTSLLLGIGILVFIYWWIERNKNKKRKKLESEYADNNLLSRNPLDQIAYVEKALLHESGLTKKAKFCIFDFTTKQTYKP